MSIASTESYAYLAEKGYRVEGRFKSLLTQVQDIMAASHLFDVAYVDTTILGEVVLNYYADIDRLKDFEGIEKANVDKIYAYTAFWFLRCKPIQLIKDHEESKKCSYINEKVCICLTLPKMLAEANKQLEDKNRKLESFCNLLLYNFKYRIYTQKSLEIMISAFLCGASFE